jgi:energy-converting hydrogenase Eha subunit G
MMRLVALSLVAIVVMLPMTVLPSPHLGWLAVPAFLVGGTGAVALLVPLATAGAAIALIEYAVALLIERPAPDLVIATAFGTALVLLLTLVHFAHRVHGAAVGPSVIRSEIRRWLMIVAIGGLATLALTIAGTALRFLLPDVALPVILIAALGALVTVAGVIALVSADAGGTASLARRSEAG